MINLLNFFQILKPKILELQLWPKNLLLFTNLTIFSYISGKVHKGLRFLTSFLAYFYIFGDYQKV